MRKLKIDHHFFNSLYAFRRFHCSCWSHWMVTRIVRPRKLSAKTEAITTRVRPTARLRNDSYLGTIHRENLFVRAGLQNVLQVFITQASNVSFVKTYLGHASATLLKEQTDSCKRVLQKCYRYVVTHAKLEPSTWGINCFGMMARPGSRSGVVSLNGNIDIIFFLHSTVANNIVGIPRKIIEASWSTSLRSKWTWTSSFSCNCGINFSRFWPRWHSERSFFASGL